MRMLALPLLVLSSVFTLSAQERVVQTETPALKEFTLPVELSKGIKADRALPGDEVRFRMVEPILAGNGVVIPGSAKLYGRIILTSPVTKERRSHLSILIDRAEWKGHSMRLNAYVVGLGVPHRHQDTAACIPDGPAPVPIHTRGGNDPNVRGTRSFSPTQNCAEETHLPEFGIRALASQIRIFTNPNGSTVLVSSKNIHFPGGILFVLKNISDATENIAERASVK